MDFNAIITECDSNLVREIVNCKNLGMNSVAFRNTGSELTATINSTSYSSLSDLFFVKGNTDVLIYVHYDGKFVKLSLGNINTFSIT